MLGICTTIDWYLNIFCFPYFIKKKIHFVKLTITSVNYNQKRATLEKRLIKKIRRLADLHGQFIVKNRCTNDNYIVGIYYQQNLIWRQMYEVAKF